MRPLLSRPIPRLLPRLLPWRLSLRKYSAPVLSKPRKFTPPSHPPSPPRRRDPKNYPGPPAPPRDPNHRYPNTMPPPNTWAYFFLTSRLLHFYISISILVVLAAWAGVANFLRTANRGRELELSWSRPIESLKKLAAAYKLHVDERSAIVAEMRRRRIEDMEKRGEFRRAHGLEKTGDEGGLGGWGVRKSGRERVSAGDDASPTGGKGGWVEDEIRKAEEEVRMAGEKVVNSVQEVSPARESVAAAGGEEGSGKKKGWWW